MAMKIRKTGVKEVRRYIQRTNTKVVPAVTASALTGLARFVRRESIKEVSQETGVRTPVLRKRIRAGRAAPWRWSATIYQNRKDVPLSVLNPIQRQGFVSVRGVGRIEGGFIKTKRGDNKPQVFEPTGNKREVTVPHIKIDAVCQRVIPNIMRTRGSIWYRREWNDRMRKRLRRGNKGGFMGAITERAIRLSEGI